MHYGEWVPPIDIVLLSDSIVMFGYVMRMGVGIW